MGRGLPPAPALPTTAVLDEALRRLKGRHNIGSRVLRRVEMVLLGITGISIRESTRLLGCGRETVKTNRRRWQGAYAELLQRAELFEHGHISQSHFDAFIHSVLSDLPRSGRSKTFTAAQ